MANKDDIVERVGIVVEPLPGAKFKVMLLQVNEDGSEEETEQVITAHLSGKMKKNFIKILPGDKVNIELSIYDLSKGRITYRNTNKPKRNES